MRAAAVLGPVGARLVRLLPARGRAAFVGSVAAGALGRAGVVGAAVFAAHESVEHSAIAPWLGAASAFAFALIFAAGRAVRAGLARQVRSTLTRAIIDALLDGDVMSGRQEGVFMATHEGLYFGQQLVATQLPSLLADAVVAPILAVVLVFEVPARVLGVGAVALVLGAAALVLGRRIGAPRSSAAQAALEPIYDDLTTASEGRLDVVASGGDDDFRAGVVRHLASWEMASARSDRLSAVAGRTPALTAVLVVGLALALDASLRGALGQSVLGTALVAASVVPVFFGLTSGVLDVLRTEQRLRPLLALFDAEPAPLGAPAGTPLPPLPSPIVWADVSFAYRRVAASPPLAVRDVRIAWQPGEVLVLQGANGSGKSTLLRLLLGLARPVGGAITVGGVDLFALDLAAWRRAVAYLPQRPYLADEATIRDAVRLVARDVADERLQAALARVGLWAALAERDPVDPLGVRVRVLSVGQRQRLALARLLCQDGAVVILDEPDANLDAEGVILVADVVRELARTRMVVLAVHTPELVRLGDARVALAGGVAVARTCTPSHAASPVSS